jgi:hypothetical protein
MLRLRFFDFFVKMWRLKAFWKVILPVPVTLNLFLALEFVLTLGILCQVLLLHPAGGSAQAVHLWGRLGNVVFVSTKTIVSKRKQCFKTERKGRFFRLPGENKSQILLTNCHPLIGQEPPGFTRQHRKDLRPGHHLP